MAKYQQFLSRIGSNRDRAALRGIFSQFLTDGDPPALKDLVLASIVLSGAETTQITISGACTTGILLSAASTTGINITGAATDGIKIQTGAMTDGIEIASVCTNGINISGATTSAIVFGVSAGKIVDAAASVSLYGGGTTGDALVLQGSSADAGQRITITGATGTTILGNLILGASGSETVVFTAKLGSQLYSNLTGAAYTVLKIHNHDTTAEIGGLETKGDLINPTGTVTGETASWTYEPTGGTGTPDGVSASSNVLAVSPAFTVTSGNIYALHGEAQCHGTLNGGAVNVAGVIGVLSGAGANTLVLHMAGVQSAVSAGFVNPTTGTLSHFLANSTGTTVRDNLICALQSQYITNFVSFDAAGGCVFVNVAITAVNTSHALRILIGGVDHYIPVFSDLSWGS